MEQDPSCGGGLTTMKECLSLNKIKRYDTPLNLAIKINVVIKMALYH